MTPHKDLFLVVDAGGSKTDWAIAGSDGTILSRYVSAGMNAALSQSCDRLKTIIEAKNNLKETNRIAKIFFYGAGCATQEICCEINNDLKIIWDVEDIFVFSDLMGTARSLFGNGKGIACILGTGSNSCLYENGVIKEQIPSLGYILGDEGSGASLGRILINSILKKALSENIINKFNIEYGLSVSQIIKHTYNSEKPATFLASFSPFLKKHEKEPEINQLIINEFNRFFENNVIRYNHYTQFEVKFSGSIANIFRNQLEISAWNYNIQIKEIIPSPIEKLVLFHNHKEFK